MKTKIPAKSWAKIQELDKARAEKLGPAREAQAAFEKALEEFRAADEALNNYLRGVADALGVDLEKARITPEGVFEQIETEGGDAEVIDE
ncbi:MAG: hypothetical protein D6698_07465 [Gammaproteobacteria bacterium]|nr:MAG: hypothetical protein D6698_07465 [Gammaproteobacteria bacterium]